MQYWVKIWTNNRLEPHLGSWRPPPPMFGKSWIRHWGGTPYPDHVPDKDGDSPWAGQAMNRVRCGRYASCGFRKENFLVILMNFPGWNFQNGFNVIILSRVDNLNWVLSNTFSRVEDSDWGGRSSVSQLRLTPTANDDQQIYACSASNPLLERAVHDAITLDVLCKYPQYCATLHWMYFVSILSTWYHYTGCTL